MFRGHIVATAARQAPAMGSEAQGESRVEVETNNNATEGDI
jgi:hypothetical protein